MVVDAESVSKQRSMFESLQSILAWASGLEMETAFMSSNARAFTSSLGTLGCGGDLFRGKLLFHAKTDRTAASMYVNRPIPRVFLRCSSLKWKEQTFVESVTEKCLPESCCIACNHCSLKHFSVGMLKNSTFSPLGPVEHSNIDSVAIYCYS